MPEASHPGGLGRLGQHTVARIGYGAMQLGDQVSDDDAVALLRRAVALGVNHIDTAPIYSHGAVNRRIRLALAPYPEDLVIVSKVGALPTSEGRFGARPAQRPEDLRAAVEADLVHLGIECVPVANLRRLDLGHRPPEWDALVVDLDDQLAEMVALRDEGKIGDIGMSNVSLEILQQAAPAGIVCVQNSYNVLNRSDESTLDFCKSNDISWVPFCPLGSAFPGARRVADNAVVRELATELHATPGQVALAWLLAHAPNTLLIPGTRSNSHLQENVEAGGVILGQDAMSRLDALGNELGDSA